MSARTLGSPLRDVVDVMPPSPGADGGSPSCAEVRALIDRANAHPLGTEFLRRGALDAVAATFGVHAFLVDAARDELG